MTDTTSPTLEPLSTPNSTLLLDPEPAPDHEHPAHDEDDEDGENDRSSDGDTASQRSISLSSPTHSPRTSISQSTYPATPNHIVPEHEDHNEPPQGSEHEHDTDGPVSLVRQGLAPQRDSHAYTLDTDYSSERDWRDDDRSSFMRRLDGSESPFSSVAPSLHGGEDDKENVSPRKSLAQIDLNDAPLQGVSASAKTSKADAQETEVAQPTPTTDSHTDEHHTDDEEHDAQELDLEREEQDIVHPLPTPSAHLSLSAGSRSSIMSFVSPSSLDYPPPPRQSPDPRRASSASNSSTYSKKVRPESMLVTHTGPLVLGIALVDFNHLVGPTIEFSKGRVFEDEEIAKIMPFLALPDGAHLTVEDYCYFHLVPSSSNPTTIFGISCNRQIRTKELLVKDQDVTRSTVQKAVVVLASKPVFGPIRDRLGVVTKALFAQRDFTDMTILEDFQSSLELSLRSQLTESGLYMGTSLRELVHTFRQRTLVLLKALMLQKRIMFYGHPVEKLCTHQYSLVALIPGLLQNLDDCGSPPLASRSNSLTQPSELKTSDPRSMMRYTGLPLELFGKDAFFQPYLPLQQLEMVKETRSWLCGSTNSIVAQQREVDLLVNLEAGVFEFRDPKLERSAGLTPADRKWMDDIVRDVNDGWDDSDPSGGAGIQFKGSDDYLRQKFDEYISGALSSVKYHDFLAKGQNAGVAIADGAGNPNAVQDFNMLWISEFKRTNAYEVWNRITDSMLFDIVEPRHPCSERPSVVSDISLRLSEAAQELAPTREAVSRAVAASSTSFFKTIEGVRERWIQRSSSTSSSVAGESPSSSVVDVTKSDVASLGTRSGRTSLVATPEASPQPPPARPAGIRPLSLVGSVQVQQAHTPPPPAPPPASDQRTSVSSWGAGITSFFSQRASRFSARQSTLGTPSPTTATPAPAPTRPTSSAPASVRDGSPAPSSSSTKSQRVNSLVATPVDLGLDELHPRNLDEIYGTTPNSSALPSPVVPAVPESVNLKGLPEVPSPQAASVSEPTPTPPVPTMDQLLAHHPADSQGHTGTTQSVRLSTSTYASGRYSSDYAHDEEVGTAL